MSTTHLKNIEGSLMMALPEALSTQMHLGEGSPVDIFVEGDRLIVEPTISRPKISYTLHELLDQCDRSAPPVDEDAEWMDAPAVGNEIL